MKNFLFVTVVVIFISILTSATYIKINEGYQSSKKNAVFNTEPKFWSWKNIKSLI